MQGPTHLVTGILIQRCLKNVRPLPLHYVSVAGLALLSHGVLDRLAKATYHPPTPLIGDWFWILSHVIVFLLTVFIVIKFWRDCKFAMACSVLPDFDWVVRSIGKWVFSGYGDQTPIHTLILRLIDFVIPHRVWDLLPNWNLARKGLLVEIVFFMIILVFIYVLQKRARETKEPISE